MYKLNLEKTITQNLGASATGDSKCPRLVTEDYSTQKIIGFSGLMTIQSESPPEKSDVKFAPGFSVKLRSYVLDHYDFYCKMCGVVPGDIDDDTGRKVRLHIGHIVDKNLGGRDELSNLRALCSTCNQGAKNITGEKPTGIWLLSQVRRAGQDEQRAVLAYLLKKFKE